MGVRLLRCGKAIPLAFQKCLPVPGGDNLEAIARRMTIKLAFLPSSDAAKLLLENRRSATPPRPGRTLSVMATSYQGCWDEYCDQARYLLSLDPTTS